MLEFIIPLNIVLVKGNPQAHSTALFKSNEISWSRSPDLPLPPAPLLRPVSFLPPGGAPTVPHGRAPVLSPGGAPVLPPRGAPVLLPGGPPVLPPGGPPVLPPGAAPPSLALP
uniref:Uncharacterized protein n=1 Tax=Amphimedon queenslandica TaxID=400682 RepID=A0A1X7TZK1_AMPQE